MFDEPLPTMSAVDRTPMTGLQYVAGNQSQICIDYANDLHCPIRKWTQFGIRECERLG
jgi:hypothetical protein